MRRKELTSRQKDILALLSAVNGLKTAEVAALLVEEPNSTGATLRSLETYGLVRRSREEIKVNSKYAITDGMRFLGVKRFTDVWYLTES